eukprot:TRINITY_DN6589_c1_g2_i1.p1 TRINITY_DN6589_c1_g2~~TRINITY_DN6589_c1_g2_i1.p1  ORF type:complete len:386 (+),score=115.72 TRINITY_DN6589_c1_g2_i1:76-1158(+)
MPPRAPKRPREPSFDESLSEVSDSLDHRIRGLARPFAARSWRGALADGPVRALLREADRLRKAGEHSYWVPAVPPRGGGSAKRRRKGAAAAEGESACGAFARSLFSAHTAGVPAELRSHPNSGCEVWVQHRAASLPAEQQGINWHFDKDEERRDQLGIVVHPHIATVTYLTQGGGAPTLVLDVKCDSSGRVELAGPKARFWASAPRRGKHLAFAGNLLHGCPPQLVKRRARRVTLLVNIWLGRRPLGLLDLHAALTPATAAAPPPQLAAAGDTWAPFRKSGKGPEDAIAIPLPGSEQAAQLSLDVKALRAALAAGDLASGTLPLRVWDEPCEDEWEVGEEWEEGEEEEVQEEDWDWSEAE